MVGVTQFDIFDLDFLESSELLDDVILHEIAHVLGFASLWSQEPFDFLQNPSLPNNPGADTHFNGPNAVAAFDDLPGGTVDTTNLGHIESAGGKHRRRKWR